MGDECVGRSDGYHCLENATRSVHCWHETVATNAQGMTRFVGILACACDTDTGYCSPYDFADLVVLAGLFITILILVELLVCGAWLMMLALWPTYPEKEKAVPLHEIHADTS